MSARQLFRSLSGTFARCQALQTHQQAIEIQVRRNFFGGRNFDPVSDLNKALKELERTSRDIERQFQNVGKNLGIPTASFPSRPIPINSDQYQITLDLAGFKPEDILVNLDGNILKINAKMNQTSEDGTQVIFQEICRTYTLPENVEVEKMASLLSHDGILSIEAPLKRSNVEKATKEPKEIPISRSVTKEDNPKK